MSIDKNTNEGKNYRNNVVKSTSGTSKSRINTGFPENISVLSPMMKEYVKTKEEYSDCILFYRLGDFYEMFFEDALSFLLEIISVALLRILQLVTVFSQNWINLRNSWMRSINLLLQRSSAMMPFF